MARVVGAADGRVGERLQLAATRRHQRAERLEPRARALGLVGEEERPLPEPLAPDRRVGLTVDGQQQPAVSASARPTWRSSSRGRRDRRRPRPGAAPPFQRQRVVVGVVVVERRARAARLHVVGHLAEEALHAASGSLPAGAPSLLEKSPQRGGRRRSRGRSRGSRTAAASSTRSTRAGSTAGRRSPASRGSRPCWSDRPRAGRGGRRGSCAPDRAAPGAAGGSRPTLTGASNRAAIQAEYRFS